MNLIVHDERISLYPTQEEGVLLSEQLNCEEIYNNWNGTELVIWFTQITQEKVKQVLLGYYQSEETLLLMHPELSL